MKTEKWKKRPADECQQVFFLAENKDSCDKEQVPNSKKLEKQASWISKDYMYIDKTGVCFVMKAVNPTGQKNGYGRILPSRPLRP